MPASRNTEPRGKVNLAASFAAPAATSQIEIASKSLNFYFNPEPIPISQKYLELRKKS